MKNGIALILLVVIGYFAARSGMADTSTEVSQAADLPSTEPAEATPSSPPSSATPAPTATITPQPTAADTQTPTATTDFAPTETPPPPVIPLIHNDPIVEGYGPDEFPFFINPLTGLLAADPEILERRPMIVKVTNYPRTVRPQAGLSFADIIYEYYMERGVPRFVGIFYGQDAEFVGPVRSGRFFDEHIFSMYDGIFVFGSADRRILDYFLSLGRHVVNSFLIESPEDREFACDPEEPRYICRDREIISYNNLFTNTAELHKYINLRNGNYRPDLTGMRFADLAPPNGTSGLNIFVRYSLFIYNWWEYSGETGQYLRYQEDIGYSDPERESYEPLIDRLTNEQLTAENVVVLVVPHEYFVWTNTTEILNIPLKGSGQAFIYRDGFAYEGRWLRPDDGGILQLYMLDGTSFPLKPGRTWYQVVSPNSVLNSEAADWRFVFNPPPTPVIFYNPEGLFPPDGVGSAGK